MAYYAPESLAYFVSESWRTLERNIQPIQRATIVFSHYPILKKRYVNTNFTDPFQCELFERDEYFETIRNQTGISKAFWREGMSRYEPIYMEDIPVFCLRALTNIPVGLRGNRLIFALTVLFYNSPFVSFERMLNYAVALNENSFSEPWKYQEVLQTVEFMFRRWISGAMNLQRINKVKYTFWYHGITIPAKDKQRAGTQCYHSNQIRKRISRIQDALRVSELDTKANISYSLISKLSSVSESTIRRYFDLGFVKKPADKDSQQWVQGIQEDKYRLLQKPAAKERRNSKDTKQAINDAIDNLSVGSVKITATLVSKVTGIVSSPDNWATQKFPFQSVSKSK